MKEALLCCYCGIREAKTKDHVPPKAIFNLPRPNNLITVPACFECNNAASKSDEWFTAYLGLHVAKKKGAAERLFQERTIPMLRHNERLSNFIFNNMKSYFLASADGQIERAVATIWNSEAHDATIEKIARGLFYHHYNKIIGDNARIAAYWFRSFPEYQTNNLYAQSIQDGAFTYFFNKARDREYDSVWFFQFYDAHWAGAMISTEG